MSAAKESHLLKGILVGIGVFILLSATVLAGIAYAYQGKFYPGVWVAGINLTGKTEAEAQALVEAKVQDYLNHPVKVILPDLTKDYDSKGEKYPDLEISTTAAELGLVFTQQDVLAKAWQIGHQTNRSAWLPTVLGTIFQSHRQALGFQVQEEEVQAFIHTKVAPAVITPIAAKVTVEKDVVTVQPPKPGLTVNTEVLARQLASTQESAMDNDTSYIRAPAEIMDSEVTLEKVQPIARTWEALGNLKVSLSAQGVALVPSKAELLSWFSPVQNEQGDLGIALQEEAITTYLQKNKSLDLKKSLTAVIKALSPFIESGDTQALPTTGKLAIAVTAKPVKEAVAGSYTADKFPGKYLEVSLADQKMYLINGATLEKVYTVSTGKWATPTPVGVFTINGKAKRAFSRTYGLYMPYWQNFKDGQYGIHELPEWPNGYKEGQNHLGTPVSHGCIRLGIGSAEEVYNWTENGTPIYIH